MSRDDWPETTEAAITREDHAPPPHGHGLTSGWQALPRAYDVKFRRNGQWVDGLAWFVDPKSGRARVTFPRRIMGSGNRPASHELNEVAKDEWVVEGNDPIPGFGPPIPSDRP